MQKNSTVLTIGVIPEKGAGAVRIWLLIVAAMVYGMILIGGATRLTDSGLSITEWKPITGALPPLSAEHWAEEFNKYREFTAEYRLQNKGMSLDEFKVIYWWEWGHRLLGRLIGIVFLAPFLAFWALGCTTPKLRRRLWGLFALGGLQGAIGWWMVSSGVGDTDLTDVAAYRLMVHFSLALIIICMAIWVWLDLGEQRPASEGRSAKGWALGLFVLIFIQMMVGALVAGLDAGRTYTDWPLMDGDIVPAGYWGAGGLANLFENVATTQFNHRTLAYVILLLSLYAGWKHSRAVDGWFKWLAVGIIAQSLLGVATLLHGAPLPLGLGHQALGTAVLITALVIVRRSTRASVS